MDVKKKKKLTWQVLSFKRPHNVLPCIQRKYFEMNFRTQTNSNVQIWGKQGCLVVLSTNINWASVKFLALYQLIWSCFCCLVATSCLFCDPMVCSAPGSSVHGFPRQDCWSRLPFPSPGDLADPGIKPESPALARNSYPLYHQGSLVYCIYQTGLFT